MKSCIFQNQRRNYLRNRSNYTFSPYEMDDKFLIRKIFPDGPDGPVDTSVSTKKMFESQKCAFGNSKKWNWFVYASGAVLLIRFKSHRKYI